MCHKIEIREIQAKDDKAIAQIIKSVLTEFNDNLEGTAFYDKETNAMFDAYAEVNSVYYVALLQDEIIAGCGIKALKDGDSTICELQKMYMKPKARGLKIGKALILKSLDFAKKAGYNSCYLETFPNMEAAINLYKKNDFIQLQKPLGNTNHHACSVWMLKNF
jgi:putative acetyltransferase